MTEDDEVMAGVMAAAADQWERLWAAVDALLQEASWAHWVPPLTRPDGVVVVGYPEYSPAMDAVTTALASVGAITPAFDWPAWRQSWHDPEGTALDTGPAADAVRYLTSVVRGERFADGTLDAAMRSGLLPRALARLRRWYDTERSGSR